jgi:hypothetical protein
MTFQACRITDHQDANTDNRAHPASFLDFFSNLQDIAGEPNA